MKALLQIVTVLIFTTSLSLFASEDWGRTGHRATGEIAEQHLSRKAKKAVQDLLDGASLALVSTYGDEIKSDERFRSYGPWHYVNYPFDSSYDAHPKSERGDLIQGINFCISVLKDEKASKEDKAFHLKMLVHFIGDLHQPLHVGVADDKGGNDFQVRWFKDGTNLHAVWDTKMIDSYNMTYSELANNASQLSKNELQAMQQGTVLDWMNESRTLCLDVYENAKTGEKLGYRYMYRYMDVVRGQLQRGGVRLAALLNQIFS